MSIFFTIGKRGLLPGEESGNTRNLRPRIDTRETTDVVDFQKHATWGTVLDYAALGYALGEARRIMLHEMEDGKGVTLPGIGTFRLSVKGEIEEREGRLHGKDVHVEGILFQPDRELLEEVRRLSVVQEPFSQMVEADAEELEEVLATLFAKGETITRKAVHRAFGGKLTLHRVTSLLQRLVGEGRLVSEGCGSTTRYRQLIIDN